MACEHENFAANVEVNRLTTSDGGPVTGYSADITIHCADCGETFVFVGAPIGLMPSRPMMSVDGSELRCPIRPQSADPHFGMGLPGFEARIAEGSTARDN